MTLLDPELYDDQIRPSQPSSGKNMIVVWLAIGTVLYLACLVSTLPAAIVLRSSTFVTLSGSIWHGRANLAGGNSGEWRVKLWRSLASFSAAAEWSIVGPRTDLSGRAQLRPGSITVDGASGRADTSLVKSLIPAMALDCDGEARVDLRHFRWTRSAFDVNGTLTSAPASCPTMQGAPIVQPLVLTLASNKGVLAATVATRSEPTMILASAKLEPSGHLQAEIRPQAASIIPGLPHTETSSGPFQLETTLTLP